MAIERRWARSPASAFGPQTSACYRRQHGRRPRDDRVERRQRDVRARADTRRAHGAGPRPAVGPPLVLAPRTPPPRAQFLGPVRTSPAAAAAPDAAGLCDPVWRSAGVIEIVFCFDVCRPFLSCVSIFVDALGEGSGLRFGTEHTADVARAVSGGARRSRWSTRFRSRKVSCADGAQRKGRENPVVELRI